MSRTLHGIAYDSVRDVIVVPQKLASAVLTFRGDSNGDVAPIRKIQGARSMLENTSTLAVDDVHGEIIVPATDSILVFSSEANGDVPPIRVIKGPSTMLGGSGNVKVDPVNNLIIATGFRVRGEGGGGGEGEEGGGGSRMLIFDRLANGDVKPLRVITSPMVGTVEAVYGPKGWIFASVRKKPGMDGRSSPDNFIGVWHVSDNGNVAPRWTIGGPNPNTRMRDARGITVDAKHKSVIVSDMFVNAVMTYEVPELFD